MSSCLSGGGRTYSLDLELVKSPSSTSTTRTPQSHNTSSPSSTLSESSNSPLAISTRKPRTPRKRPNQTYNEAAALLSTAYPNLFSTKHLTKKNPISNKFSKQRQQPPPQPPPPVPHDSSLFVDDSSDLLFPFRVIDTSSFLLHHQPIQEKPSSHFYSKAANLYDKPCESSSGEIDSHGQSVKLGCGEAAELIEEDFDTESILDEEIEEGVGIDSIMGNLSVTNNDTVDEPNGVGNVQSQGHSSSWYKNPMGTGFGGKFEFGLGMRNGVRAFRNVDDGNWWSFPIVDMLQISPKFNTNTNTSISNGNNKVVGSIRYTGDKKKKKVEKPAAASMEAKDLEKEVTKESNCTLPKSKSGSLLLKLNYDEVLNAWSGRGSPFSDDIPGCSDGSGTGNDLSARLAQIDLFSESGVREASVLRYKEKRRTRLFSKKIRYEVRKVNADQRPRLKGRFVRRPNSKASGGQR